MGLREKMSFLVCAFALTAAAIAGILQATAAEAGRVHTIVIEGMKFNPSLVRAAVGDRVIFQNKDILPHTATAQKPKAFDSGLIKAGESWTLQVSTAQTIRYACLYHPTMEGTILVETP